MTQQTFLSRSFVYRKLDTLAAHSGEFNGYKTLASIKAPESEMEQVKKLSLCDLSALPRTGFKGKGTIEWLAIHKMSVPEKPNLAINNSEGCLIIRLGLTEIMLLGNVNEKSEFITSLNESWYQYRASAKEPHGYILPRQDSHACFALSGKYVADMFSKTCAVDLRPTKFKNHMVAQTSVARVGCIIIRSDLDETLNYYLLADTSSAEYLWDCLLDAMHECGGTVVGLQSIKAFLKS